jgi:hypothetical protein
MKNLFTLLFIMLTAFKGEAQVNWAKGKFWQVPYPKIINYSLTVSAEHLPLIQKDCEEFRNRVFRKDGRVLDQAQALEMFRTSGNPLGILWGIKYLVRFHSDMPLTGSLLTDAAQAQADKASAEIKPQDKLPWYTQDLVWLGMNDPETVQLKLVTAEGSLSQVSENLGLEPSMVIVKRFTDGISLEISGRDIACDLLANQVEIHGIVEAHPKIDMMELHRLENLYKNVKEAYEQTKNISKMQVRATRIIKRTDKMLKEAELPDRDKAEDYLENMMDVSFDEQFMPTDVLSPLKPFKPVSVNLKFKMK